MSGMNEEACRDLEATQRALTELSLRAELEATKAALQKCISDAAHAKVQREVELMEVIAKRQAENKQRETERAHDLCVEFLEGGLATKKILTGKMEYPAGFQESAIRRYGEEAWKAAVQTVMRRHPDGV